MLRVFTASLGTETNTFSPLPTGLASFAERMLWRPGQHPNYPTEQTAVLWKCRERAARDGWMVIEGTCASAAPAGITTRSAYESLRDEILTQLATALPVDLVALGMHGAMVAEGYDDCEGDLLARVRTLVGPSVPVGAEIDPHSHLTAAMTDNATAIVAFKEYPHIDYLERADELLDILVASHQRRVRPRMVSYDCHMVGLFHTFREPMQGFLRRVRAFESDPDILSISVIHSFPWADVPDLGTRILVVADGPSPRADAVAQTLGRALYAMRGRTTPEFHTWEEALEVARKADRGPIVIADTADNPGGGAPGDSTYGLRRVLALDMRRVALGPLFDPVAVRIAHEAGVGSQVDLRIGGKLGATSGPPVDIRATVTAAVTSATQTFMDHDEPLGDAASIHVDGVDIVLTSQRCQAFSPDLFSRLSIDPRACRLLIVKSAHHFHHGFAPIADRILYVAADGALSFDFARLPYRKLTRPLWPIDPAAGPSPDQTVT